MGRKLKTKTFVWTESELERKSLVEAGETVLVNLSTDLALIEWAKAEGLFVRIDRRSIWGNPFKITKKNDRTTVIQKFAEAFVKQTELQEQLGDLQGKVLGCWCYPEACHGCILIEHLKRQTHDQIECRRLCSSR